MTTQEDTAKMRLFSIRNLLLAVTTLLMIVVIVLSASQVFQALDAKNKANRALELNDLVDNMVQFKLALADERLFTSLSYGYKTSVPSQQITQIEINRNVVADAYDNIVLGLANLPEFDFKTDNESKHGQASVDFKKAVNKLKTSYAAYTEQHATTDSDLEDDGTDNDVSNAGKATSSVTDLIDVTAEIRGEIESNYDFGNDRISTVNRLKTQLWVMLEYASREAASLSENIASMEPIGDIKASTSQRYTGIGQGAWEQVKYVAMSASATAEISQQLSKIQDIFFTEFETARFDLYDTSVYAEEDGEETVDYGMSPDEWITLARESNEPVSMMVRRADSLAKELNDRAVSTANSSVITAATLMVLSLAIGGLALWVVMLRVVRPVNQLSDTMIVLAGGNLDAEIPNTDRDDEVGDMAKSVQVFKENAIERQAMEAQQREREEEERERAEEAEAQKREEEEERRIVEEQRAEEARQERRQAMLELADKFEASVMAVVEGVSNSASEMENAARGLSDTAADTSQKSDVVSNAAQQASSNAQMVASAAEELSSSVREITGQTNQSSAAARDAVSRTDNAGKDVAELVDAAQKIGDVVKLINDIAEQTNLLALNATIEAARAGDAGKGFAVVASEVKSLANQTAKATQEISEQVDGMQRATNLAVNAMDDIKNIISDIESTSVSIASAVEEQDASTQEIARNVSEVSTGTEEVTSNIHAVNQGATTTGSAATEVLSAAQILTQQSTDLRHQVESFLATIRA
ncbi:methyl-accepting chemotaxis protein [Kordiimonas aquimaris]|uniref:methyl-accepting chemotaxis protein n=1 Tax=Kordiimonas aquimaris TaxID=707591 RepID=UPI0021CFF0BC|nr:HAMP domain-containing methyl-accepting chemotaxis protein [Kordiimonas aquimaris]